VTGLEFVHLNIKPQNITDDIFLAQNLGHKLLGPNASLSVGQSYKDFYIESLEPSWNSLIARRPIPGTTKLHRLEENLGAANVELTADNLAEIERAAAEITVEGERYPGAPSCHHWPLTIRAPHT
jgi:hypothetical protein